MDAKVVGTDLFERLQQQHTAIEERLAQTAALMASALDKLAAALAHSMEGEAENGRNASRSASAASEPAVSGAVPSPELAGAASMATGPRQDTSQPDERQAAAGGRAGPGARVRDPHVLWYGRGRQGYENRPTAGGGGVVRGIRRVKRAAAVRVCSIPLPAAAELPRAGAAAGRAGELVAAFLRATQGLSCDSAAALAGVLPETMRKWRRRLPRGLKASTARRLAAHLTGERPATAGDPLERAFRRTLRHPEAGPFEWLMPDPEEQWSHAEPAEK